MKVRFFLFKLFLKGAIKFAPHKEVAHTLKERLVCLEREREMQACVRPRKEFYYEDDSMEQ